MRYRVKVLPMMYLYDSLGKIWPLIQKRKCRQGIFTELYDPGDLKNSVKVMKILSFCLAVLNKYLQVWLDPYNVS